MSKFFIGCPVRIIYSVAFPELVGKTGRIVGAGTYPATERNNAAGDAGKQGWDVKPDMWESNWCPYPVDGGKVRFMAKEDQLEPIVPEGMKPTTWEKCLWQPEKSLVTI